MNSLVMTIYGDSGTGKTPAAATAPAPRLILDTEAGAKFLPGKKVTWDPQREAPPVADGTWETCLVQCRDWATFEAALAYLHAGQHGFASVIVDSLSELQKRCRDLIMSQARDETLNERQWGVLLQKCEKAVREMRDLVMHPVKPISVVVLVCLADEFNGKKMPLLQGGLKKSLPGFMDVLSYVSADIEGNVSMSVQANSMHLAKDRTGTLPARMAGPFDIAAIQQHVHNTLEGNQQ